MFLRAGVIRQRRRALRSLSVAALTLATCIAREVASAQVPGELRGRVTDATTGRAVGGARIEIADRVEVIRADGDGTFAVRGLEPQTYAVTVRAVGFVPFHRDVAIENGRTATLDPSLQPAPTRLSTVVSSATPTGADGTTLTFDRASIESSGRHDVAELLTGASGVVIMRSGGPGQPSQASIRGSSAAEVLVLVDGTVVNSPLTGVADLSQLPLAGVERVTVLEGAQSSRYGGRALAGVIIVETRRAASEGSLAMDAGSWGERAVGATLGDATHMEGGSGANGLISAERRTIEGDFPYDVPAVRGGGTARRVNSDASTTSLLGVGGFNGALGNVRLRADWRSTDRGLAGSIVQPSLTGRDDEHHAAAAVEFSSRPGALSFDGSGSLSRDYAHVSDPTPPFGSSYDDVLHATEARGAASATATSAFGAATFGGDARRIDVDATSLAPGSPNSQRILGAYANLRSERDLGSVGFAATASERLDHDDLIANTASSPRASVSVTRGVGSISGSIGDGYSPPSLADQFFHEGVLVKANPSLAPERTRGDAELRAALRELSLGVATLSGDAAVYRADVHGMILWSPDFRFIWSPANIDVHRSGWQLGGRIALPTFSAATISGSVDHTDVVYAGGAIGGQVIYRPRVTARIAESVGRRFARVDVETRFVGSRRTVAGTDLNSLDPYWLTDVRLAVPVGRGAWGLDGTVGVENVFDRPASMLVDFPFGGRRWTFGLRASRRGIGDSG